MKTAGMRQNTSANKADGDDTDAMLHQLLAIQRPPFSQPTWLLSNSSTPRSSSSSSSSAAANTAPKVNSPVVKLQFINTAHPSESTSAKRISQIRSHVAKDSHARRRQRKACKAGKACCSSSSAAAVAADHAARTESDSSPDSTSASAVVLPVRARLPQSSFLDEKEGLSFRGFRRIAPKTGALDPNAVVPCPRQLIGDTRKDGWNGSFAWELTDDEYLTFNFFLDWVLTYGYEICFPRGELGPVMKRMKSAYVPYAIKHPSLLSCIFYISYHRRALTTTDPEDAARCNFMMERYRLACIEMMKKAVEAEERPTYQTITLAMQLCSEAAFEGNPDISFTHAYAARTMVAARGGLESFDNAGYYSLLSFLLATSVYSGNYWFVPGCAKAPEDWKREEVQ